MATIKNPLIVIKQESGSGWQPDADMQWAKGVCENDTQAGFTYKVLQMISDGYRYTNIVVPSGGAVKTSDGQYYTSNAKHTWDDTNARQSAVGAYKVRWLIYYYAVETPTITLLDDVQYVCFDEVKFGKIFSYRYNLRYFDIINGANLSSSVTNTNGTFYNCYSLQSIPLIDTSSATDMSSMFASCNSLQSIPLIDTSSATNMGSMFASCNSLQSIPLIDTSSATNMSSMFSYCSSLQTVSLSDTSSATNMSSMFSYCSSLQTVSLSDTSSVTNMSNMFYQCSSLQTVSLSDTSSVTNMGSMFSGCIYLQSATLNLNGITSASKQSDIFNSCSKLEFPTLTNIKWNLSLTASTKYSQATLEAIIDNLVDLTGQTAQTLTVGSTNLAKISASKIAEAQAKNWSVV